MGHSEVYKTRVPMLGLALAVPSHSERGIHDTSHEKFDFQGANELEPVQFLKARSSVTCRGVRGLAEASISEDQEGLREDFLTCAMAKRTPRSSTPGPFWSLFEAAAPL